MKSIHQKYPFYLSMATAIYFTLYSLAFHFQWRHVLVGVFTEMFTIPAIIITPIVALYAMARIIKHKKRNAYTITTLLLSITTIAYVIYRFVNH
ncbi:hypothetical protein [Kordia sp.]|uniref:hypothetical protein n=1 Tax=Kordia sp. TaxID=1965332 RepID=UPI003B5AD09C